MSDPAELPKDRDQRGEEPVQLCFTIERQLKKEDQVQLSFPIHQQVKERKPFPLNNKVQGSLAGGLVQLYNFLSTTDPRVPCRGAGAAVRLPFNNRTMSPLLGSWCSNGHFFSSSFFPKQAREGCGLKKPKPVLGPMPPFVSLP
eukprot:314688-Pelagomonas_calceolata.AAC.3